MLQFLSARIWSLDLASVHKMVQELKKISLLDNKLISPKHLRSAQDM
jgi:hypothetical protein